MMPPKKSKAAREFDDKQSEPSTNGDNHREDEKKVDIFKVHILDSKRERTVPIHETVFHSWINENFEDKEGVNLNLGEIYDYYLDMCSLKKCNAVEQPHFNKVMKESYPSGFTVKETSELHGEVKEKKITKKKEKVEGETMKLKMKDIVHDQLEEMGNPRTGVRFNSLLKHISAKYPALRLDFNSSPLMRCLNNGVYYGHMYVVKGVGKCGFYRVWKAGMEDEDEEDEEVEDEKNSKKEKKEDGATDEGEGSAEDGEKDSAEEGGEKSGEDTKKGVKRKAAKPKAKGAKKKKRPAKKATIVHSDPQRVRDCFPLAMTYMSEPKIASVRRIKQYMENYYGFANDNKLKKVLEEGIEKGWWGLVSGSVSGGSFELLVDEFDPTDDDDVWGKIVNALTACTEPKQCSANLLKKYVTEYHPQFKVQEKQYIFKRALEGAVNADELRQMSGLGCTGSFQLVEKFFPGPNILAGKDTESDYDENESDDDDEASDSEESDTEMETDVSYFQTSAYVPRPSKRRGKARKMTPIEKLTYVPTAPKKHRKGSGSGRPAAKKAQGGKRRKVQYKEKEDSSSEEEEEEDEPSSEDDSEYGKPAEKYKARPSKSRTPKKGGKARAASPPPPSPKKGAAKGRGRPAKAAAAAATPAAKGKGKGRGRPPTPKAEPPASPAKAAVPAKGKAKGRGRPSKRRR